MRYTMSQKAFSLSGDFRITNAAGKDCFVVRSKHFSLGSKAIIEDLRGRELARIRQRLLTLNRVFDVFRLGQKWATARRKVFTFVRSKYTVSIRGDSGLTVTGNFFDREHTFQRLGSSVASVSKKWLTLGDTYAIDVIDAEDDVLVLSIVIAIHYMAREDRTAFASG